MSSNEGLRCSCAAAASLAQCDAARTALVSKRGNMLARDSISNASMQRLTAPPQKPHKNLFKNRNHYLHIYCLIGPLSTRWRTRFSRAPKSKALGKYAFPLRRSCMIFRIELNAAIHKKVKFKRRKLPALSQSPWRFKTDHSGLLRLFQLCFKSGLTYCTCVPLPPSPTTTTTFCTSKPTVIHTTKTTTRSLC